MAAITPEDIARHYLARFSMAIHLESIRGKPSARNLPPKKSSYHIEEKSSSHSSDSAYPQPKQPSENRQKDEPQRLDASPVSQQEQRKIFRSSRTTCPKNSCRLQKAIHPAIPAYSRATCSTNSGSWKKSGYCRSFPAKIHVLQSKRFMSGRRNNRPLPPMYHIRRS